MQSRELFYRVCAALLCLTVSFAAQANDEKYLREKTYHMDPSEMPRMPPGSGDYPQDYQYTGNPNVGDAQARRQRVESRVQAYMKELHSTEHHHDDREPEITPQMIRDLAGRAQAGDPKAMGGMGYAYQHGLGVEKNEKLAVQWYERATQYGEHQYYSTIGDMYRDYGNQSSGFFDNIRAMMSGSKDSELQKDNTIAREWYEKGIRYPDHDWRAYMALGEMYRDGTGGLEKDPARANANYNRGLALKKQYDERMLHEIQDEVRKQAEKEERVDELPRPPELTSSGRRAPEKKEEREAGQAMLMIDGITCTYAPSTKTRRGYSQLFDAQCPDLRGKQLEAKQVRMSGLQCDIERHTASTSLLLMCNAADEGGIRIGNATCSLRPERDQAGFTAVYGAYCGGQPDASVKSVSHMGMECAVQPARATDGKTYTLRCGSVQQPAQQEQATGTSRTVRLGSYNCSLRQMESPTATYKFFYEAYCGGLSQSEKSSGAIPGSISIGVNLCNVEPWPQNDQGKDFELHCR